jgi:hypothetical protein
MGPFVETAESIRENAPRYRTDPAAAATRLTSFKTIFRVVKEKDLPDRTIGIVKSLYGDLCVPG